MVIKTAFSLERINTNHVKKIAMKYIDSWEQTHCDHTKLVNQDENTAS